MFRDRLVVGLKDQTLSKRLQMDSELTLKKAVDLARSSERIKKKNCNKCCATMIVTYQLKPLDKNHPRNLGDPLEVALNLVTGVVITHHNQEQNALLKKRAV